MIFILIIAFVGSLSLLVGSALPVVILTGFCLTVWLAVIIGDSVESRAERRRIAAAKARRASRNRRGF